MHDTKALAIGCFVLSSLVVAPGVSAATFSYDLVVTEAFGPHAAVLPAGTRVVISYTLDATVADTNSDPVYGLFPRAVLNLSVFVPRARVVAVAGSAGTAQTFDNVVEPTAGGQWADGVWIFGGPIILTSRLGGERISFLEVDFGTDYLPLSEEPTMLSSDALPLFKLPIIGDGCRLWFGTQSGYTQVILVARRPR